MATANPFRFSTKYQDDETGAALLRIPVLQSSTGRWVSRDPIGEDGGLNVYAFVGGDSLGETDDLGLCKACTCKSVKITFFPGGNNWQADFYRVPETGDEMFGTVFIITWAVEGDETKCRYFLNETPKVEVQNPKGSDTYRGTGGWVELFRRVYNDHSGVNLAGEGKYKVKYHFQASYACEDSDGTRLETPPTRWKKTFSEKWPKR